MIITYSLPILKHLLPAIYFLTWTELTFMTSQTFVQLGLLCCVEPTLGVKCNELYQTPVQP